MIIMPSSRKMTFQSMPVSSREERALGVDDPEQHHRGRAAQGGRDPVDPLGGDQDVGADEDRDDQDRRSSAARRRREQVVQQPADRDRAERSRRRRRPRPAGCASAPSPPRSRRRSRRASTTGSSSTSCAARAAGRATVLCVELAAQLVGGLLVVDAGQRRVVLDVAGHQEPQHLRPGRTGSGRPSSSTTIRPGSRSRLSSRAAAMRVGVERDRRDVRARSRARTVAPVASGQVGPELPTRLPGAPWTTLRAGVPSGSATCRTERRATSAHRDRHRLPVGTFAPYRKTTQPSQAATSSPLDGRVASSFRLARRRLLRRPCRPSCPGPRRSGSSPSGRPAW